MRERGMLLHEIEVYGRMLEINPVAEEFPDRLVELHHDALTFMGRLDGRPMNTQTMLMVCMLYKAEMDALKASATAPKKRGRKAAPKREMAMAGPPPDVPPPGE